ncbi:MAG: hypothetical protein IPH08_04450 [Rhodocyclaceae bacterium]|nr:hypothetical protein [Rhodocyclaceae bacterium]
MYKPKLGSIFSVCNQAVVSTTAGLATTFTGLAIANPSTSGVDLILKRFTCTQTAVGVAGSVGLMGGVGVAAGSLTPINRNLGSGIVAKATASAGATISTPLLIETYGCIGSVATTGYGLQPGIVIELNESIIVPPGSFLASYTTAATTNALVFSMTWEERPR